MSKNSASAGKNVEIGQLYVLKSPKEWMVLTAKPSTACVPSNNKAEINGAFLITKNEGEHCEALSAEGTVVWVNTLRLRRLK